MISYAQYYMGYMHGTTYDTVLYEYMSGDHDCRAMIYKGDRRERERKRKDATKYRPRARASKNKIPK